MSFRGKNMSRKILPRRELELFLDSIETHPAPKLSLEQYTISAEVAAEILYIAAFQHDDIVDKNVIDLGTGTGRLALGAAFLGAKTVTGVDIDSESLATAHKQAMISNLDRNVQWVLGDIEIIVGKFDTVLQNPPFGVRRRGADRRFIEKALELGGVTYTLHKSGLSNREFIKRLVQKHAGSITEVYQMDFVIPRTFQFHRKRRYHTRVDLFRMMSNGTKC
jgi:putative methylase